MESQTRAEAPSLAAELGAADAALIRAAGGLDWMTAATPVNAAEERSEMVQLLERGEVPRPRYSYRRFEVPPWLRVEIAGHLRRVEGERSALAGAYADKLRETLLVADLVEAVGTERFPALSSAVFGRPTRRAIRDAVVWLGTAAPAEPRTVPFEGSDSLASGLKEEMRRYGLDWPILRDRRYAATVMLRRGAIVLGGGERVSRLERERLCAHEIGVHVVALANALAHPFGLFALGTAGCLGDHEGAALCAEEERGALTACRRARIGARALAAASACAGEPQGELARRLVDEHGLPPWDAAVAAERGYRGGGLAKDLAYIPGYGRVRRALDSGTLDLAAFLSGRMRLDDVPLVRTLLDARLLPAPRRLSLDLA